MGIYMNMYIYVAWTWTCNMEMDMGMLGELVHPDYPTDYTKDILILLHNSSINGTQII
jgi:hypothetical protein